MAYIDKPIIKDEDVWASSTGVDDILIPYEKIDEGWGYANKPSYQYLNWYWNTVTQFFVHLNQNGLAVWDKDTIYSSGGFTKYNGRIYQTFSDTLGEEPDVNSRNWSSLEFLNGLQDVEIDIPEARNILVLEDNIWTNQRVRDALSVELDELNNVDVTDHQDSILVSNGTNNPTDADSWINVDRDAFIKEKIYIEDAGDTLINDPVTDEVLQYREVEIWYEPEQEYRKEYRWINTYPKGYVAFDNIIDRPEEYNPVLASETQVGGARMWISGTAPVTSFNVATSIKDYVPAPFDLKAESHDVGGVATLTLTWTGTSLANNYKVYKDGENPQTTSETSYDVLDPDADKWSVYYVTAVNADGSSESYPSNYVMGIRK